MTHCSLAQFAVVYTHKYVHISVREDSLGMLIVNVDIVEKYFALQAL